VVDAFSPCILFIDEIEKGLSGIQSSGQTDGGTGSRVFSTFLTWLNDHKSRVFVVATCNDVSKMPPEFLRAERWDAIFFVDLPTTASAASSLTFTKDLCCVRRALQRPGRLEWGRDQEPLPYRRDDEMQPGGSRTLCDSPVSEHGRQNQGLREWAKTRTIPASIEEREQKTNGKEG